MCVCVCVCVRVCVRVWGGGGVGVGGWGEGGGWSAGKVRGGVTVPNQMRIMNLSQKILNTPLVVTTGYVSQGPLMCYLVSSVSSLSVC